MCKFHLSSISPRETAVASGASSVSLILLTALPATFTPNNSWVSFIQEWPELRGNKLSDLHDIFTPNSFWVSFILEWPELSVNKLSSLRDVYTPNQFRISFILEWLRLSGNKLSWLHDVYTTKQFRISFILEWPDLRGKKPDNTCAAVAMATTGSAELLGLKAVFVCDRESIERFAWCILSVYISVSIFLLNWNAVLLFYIMYI